MTIVVCGRLQGARNIRAVYIRGPRPLTRGLGVWRLAAFTPPPLGAHHSIYMYVLVVMRDVHSSLLLLAHFPGPLAWAVSIWGLPDVRRRESVDIA